MGKDAVKDRDEYIAENIFWVPPEARWQHLKNETRRPTTARSIDDAMITIERDNPAFKDVLPKDYARPALDKSRLGQVVDMVSNIKVGGAEARATDVLGNIYEYFPKRFAIAVRVAGRRVLHPALGRAAPREDDACINTRYTKNNADILMNTPPEVEEAKVTLVFPD